MRTFSKLGTLLHLICSWHCCLFPLALELIHLWPLSHCYTLLSLIQMVYPYIKDSKVESCKGRGRSTVDVEML